MRSMRIAFGVWSWLSLRSCPTSEASFAWYFFSQPRRQRIRPAISSSGKPARKAIMTAGQAFSQFTVIFMLLICVFSVSGKDLTQSQSIGLLLFTQKICWVRISCRLFETLTSCCWLICRLMAIISWLPSCLLSWSSSSRRISTTWSSASCTSGFTSLECPSSILATKASLWKRASRCWLTSNCSRRKSAMRLVMSSSSSADGRVCCCW